MTLAGVNNGMNAVSPMQTPAPASAPRREEESETETPRASAGASVPPGPTKIRAAAGDTAFGIAQHHREAMGADLCQIVAALWRRNPHAFEQSDMNRLKPGAEIELPDIGTVRAMGPEEARRLCAIYIDAAEQRRHGTVDMTVRKSFDEQRQLQAGELELVYFGDTLGQIANRFNCPGATQNQKLVAIANANPDAFRNANMNDLLTGVLLRMPSAEQVHAIDANAAKGQVSSQWATYKEYTQPSKKC